MRPLIEIVADEARQDDKTLICEIGPGYFSFVVADVNKKVFAFAVYNFDGDDTRSQLHNIFEVQSLLNHDFKKVYVIYSTQENVMIPFSLYRSEKNNDTLSLIHGDLKKDDIVLTDVLIAHQVYNVYRVDHRLIEYMMEKLPKAITFHQQSVMLSQGVAENDSLYVIVYPTHIFLRACRNGQPVLFTILPYKQSEEVIYNLLNICKQHELQNCSLTLSGLVEKDSAIYKELHKYYSSIDFAADEFEKADALEEYPSHYYSSLLGVDACE